MFKTFVKKKEININKKDLSSYNGLKGLFYYYNIYIY